MKNLFKKLTNNNIVCLFATIFIFKLFYSPAAIAKKSLKAKTCKKNKNVNPLPCPTHILISWFFLYMFVRGCDPAAALATNARVYLFWCSEILMYAAKWHCVCRTTEIFKRGGCGRVGLKTDSPASNASPLVNAKLLYVRMNNLINFLVQNYSFSLLFFASHFSCNFHLIFIFFHILNPHSWLSIDFAPHVAAIRGKIRNNKEFSNIRASDWYKKKSKSN